MRAGELRIQRCTACGAFRHPPRPVCAQCGASESDWPVVAGTGEVWSFTIVHPPTLPAFADRVKAVVVRLDEGVFLVSNLVDCPVEEIGVGQRGLAPARPPTEVGGDFALRCSARRWLAAVMFCARERLPVSARPDRRVVGLQPPVVVGRYLPVWIDEKSYDRGSRCGRRCSRCSPVVVVGCAGLLAESVEEPERLASLIAVPCSSRMFFPSALDGHLRPLAVLPVSFL